MPTTRAVEIGVGAVLDLEPDLGSGISAQDWDIARRTCRAGVIRIPRGRWTVPLEADDRRHLIGLLINSGMICREVALRDRHMLELLGPGDVLQLPVDAGRPRLGGNVMLTAVAETQMLALGSAFIGAAARWPSLLSNLQGRLEAQREHLAILGLIAHLSRADHRLLLTLVHLADRWGHVTTEGTLLPLPLTHDLLAQLAAARRSTATLALSSLEGEGLVVRQTDGSWLLPPAAQNRALAIGDVTSAMRSVGELLALRVRMNESREGARALRAEAELARQAAPRRRERPPA